MAFPFVYGPLRQRILIAIGSAGLVGTAALGCSAKHDPTLAGAAGVSPPSPAGRSGAAAHASDGGATPPRAGASGGSAGSGPLSCDDGLRPVERECFVPSTMQQKATFGCGQIPISPTPTAEEVKAKFLPNGCLKQPLACNSCCNRALEEGEPQADGSCCYAFCTGACCGRPFLVDGEARVAAVERRSDWLQPASRVADSAEANARIATEWLEDALMEHASIASFARFTLDLLAYGAPAELVEMSQRAGLDEVEHARLCFGLAARYSGVEHGPAALSAAGVSVAASLWDAAIAAFQEGCIGETVAALQARAALDHARDSEAQRVLGRIADDEARHAELAWRFVTWCVRRLGPSLTHELQRVLAVHVGGSSPDRHDDEPTSVLADLHAAGRLTALEKSQVARAAIHEVILPCLAALTAQQPLAAARVTAPDTV